MANAHNSYEYTRGRAAAIALGLRDEKEIAAFLAGAAWMGKEMERVYTLTPRPDIVFQNAANNAARGPHG